MHTRNPLLDEIAKLSTAAVGMAQAAGEEAKSAVRAQADRMAAELDLVRRDEHEALKAEVAQLRALLERLTADQSSSSLARCVTRVGTSPRSS